MHTDFGLDHRAADATCRQMGRRLALAALASLSLSLLTLGSLAMAQTPAPAFSQDAHDRMADLQRSMADLQSTNDQIATFTSDLNEAKANQGLVAARQTKLIQTGETLKTEIRAIAGDRKAYEGEVAQHDGQCPQSTTDAGLAARCQAWWEQLEITRKDILAQTTQWTGRKDKLFGAIKAWDADTAEAARRVQYLQYSLDHLRLARDRIVAHLGQINQSILDCRKAITSGTEEDMVERCGQLWDGNALHPGLINKGTGSRLFRG